MYLQNSGNACDACVYGAPEHAEWCPAKKREDPIKEQSHFSMRGLMPRGMYRQVGRNRRIESRVSGNRSVVYFS
jgi:hypothetical protein